MGPIGVVGDTLSNDCHNNWLLHNSIMTFSHWRLFVPTKKRRNCLNKFETPTQQI